MADFVVTTRANRGAGSVRQAIFIDARVPDLATLVRGAAEDAVVHVLAPERDGVAQIVGILAAEGLRGLAALSLVAHGVPGALTIGSSRLDADALQTRGAALASIGASLAPGGSVLLYACDVGRGEAGRRFAADLSAVLGTNVRAARHPVGAATLGGSWVLDVGGETNAPVGPFAPEALLAFHGLLPGGNSYFGSITPGGQVNDTGPGQDGSGGPSSGNSAGGGGGGGAGTTGGDGGDGGRHDQSPPLGGAGGSGGASAGAAGADGSPGGSVNDPDSGTISGGGGGGGGGAHGFVDAALPDVAASGGRGGNGGAALISGGGGGAGGFGAVVTGAGDLGLLDVGATGGQGGEGGRSTGTGFAGGDGGSGGTGLKLTDASGVFLTIASAVTGGAGGSGGSGNSAPGANGAGGAGVVGQNLDLTLAASANISGGLSGGGALANAITFTGGSNTLTLLGGSTISGNVVADNDASTDDTLALGGATSASFDVDLIGTQYQNFDLFQKTGSCTWTLTGSNASLSWTVDAGTLQVNGAIGDVTVNVGGTLGGSGTVGAVTFNGGTLSPGNSPGLMNTGSLSGAFTFDAELGGTDAGVPHFDQIAVTGTVDLTNATLNVIFINDFVPAPLEYAPGLHDRFQIITNDSNDAVTGNFTGLPEGTVFTIDGVPLLISYHGGDGNDVVLAEASHSFVVTTLDDELDARDTNLATADFTDLSLREALALANSLPGADTITFDPILTGGTTPGVDNGRLVLTNGELVVSSDVTINGDVNGDHKADIVVDGDNISGVFHVSAGASTFDALAVTGGYATSGAAFLIDAGASATISHSIVAANYAENNGGAIDNGGTLTVTDSLLALNEAYGHGGALYNHGTATLTSTTLYGNYAAAGGALYNHGTASLTNATLYGNYADAGGAIFNAAGDLTISQSTITGNYASTSGGGIFADGDVGTPGHFTLTNSIVAGNDAGDGMTTDLKVLSGADNTHTGVNIFQQADAASPSDIPASDLHNVFATVGVNSFTGVESGLLADNAGPVPTVGIKLGGLAQDVAGADSAVPLGLTTDARGFDRVSGPHVDLGAVELQPGQSFVVTTLNDELDSSNPNATLTDFGGAGDLSLREALVLAQQDPLSPDTITFTPTLVGGSNAGVDDGHLTLTQGELFIAGNVTIDGDVHSDGTRDIAVDAGGFSRVFDIYSGTTTLNGLTITNGYDFINGGGVAVGVFGVGTADVTISNSLVTNGYAGYGGGISVDPGSSLRLINSTVSGNQAYYSGGGIANAGTLTVINSTISGNTSDVGGNGYAYGGGGLLNDTIGVATLTNTTVSDNHGGYAGGGVFNSGDLTLTNATLANNDAETGGGLYNATCGCIPTTLLNSTVTGNYASDKGGGVANHAGAVTITNSIVAGNGAGADGPDVFSAPAATTAYAGVNVFSQADAGDAEDRIETDLANVFAAIDPVTGGGWLANNGGPTQTVGLARSVTNPALDAADSSAPATDQRGDARDELPAVPNVSTSADIGAFELQNQAPTVTPDSYQVDEDHVLTVAAPAGVLHNDSDSDGDPFSAALVDAPLHGALTFNADGSFTYTPEANYNGSDGFIYKVSDNFGDNTTANVALTVNAVNDAPTIALQGLFLLDAVATNPGATVSVLLNDGAGGLSPGTPVFARGSDDSVALGDVDGDGRLDAVTANDNGTVSVLLNNGTGGFNPGTPVAAGGSRPNSVALGDVNGDGLLDAVTANEGDGTVSVLLNNGSGGFNAGTPVAASGTTPISVALGDVNGDGLLDAVTANQGSNTVSVLLNNGSGGFNAGTPVAVGGSHPLSVALGDVNGDGRIDAVTANEFSNTVSVLINNGAGSFNPGTSVAAGGSLPFSVALGDVNGDGRLDAVTANRHDNTVSVLLNNGAGGFNAGTAVAAGGSEPFSVALGDVNGDGRVDGVTANFSSNSLGVLLNNGADGFNPGTPVAAGPNPQSVALGDVNNSQIVAEDTPLPFSGANGNAITVADIDSGGAAETLALSVAHGTLTLAAGSGVTVTSGANGSGAVTISGTIAQLNAALNGLSYQGVLNFNGLDTLTATINDAGHTGSGGPLTTTRLIPITLTPVDDAPAGADKTVTTNEDTPYTFAATDFGFSDPIDAANGAHGADSLLAVKITTLPGAGTLTDNNVAVNAGVFIPVADITGGKLKFVPAADANGTGYASFTFQVQDNGGTANGGVDSAPSPNTITINVPAANDPPVAQNGAKSGNEDAAISGAAVATDVDNTQAQLTYLLVGTSGGAQHGAVSMDAAGNFTYTPAANFNGTDSFTFKANDGAADSNVATINLTINAINDAPVAQNGAASGNEDTAITGAAVATDVDNTQAQLTYLLVGASGGAQHGAVSMDAAGNFTYTPAANFNGTDSFTFKANDGSADSNAATINLTINAINDAPVAQNGSASGNEDSTINGTLVATDVDSASWTYSRVADAAHGNVIVNADGTFSYTPNANFNGSDSFTFKANDGSLDSNIAIVNLSVSAVNDPPVITSDGGGDTATVSVLERTTSVTTVVATDPDGPSLTYSIVGGSDAAKFHIDAATGALSFVTAPNFDIPTDADHNNSYLVQVRASDGSLSDDQTITVNITDNPSITSTVHWIQSVDISPHPAGWLPSSIGDFNADGTSDLAWFNATTGDIDIWKLQNGQWAGSSDVGSHPAGYQPALTGDFNHDGTSDVAWYNPTTRDIDIWKISNGQWAGSSDVGSHPAGFQPALAGDFNGDGTSDIAWYNPTTNDLDIWKIANGQWAGSSDVGSHPAGYMPVLAGDFNGDGTSDVAWYNPTTHDLDIWKISNGQWAGSVDVGQHPAGWQPLGAADFNLDGTPDIAWYNPTTNDIDIWIIKDGHWAASFDIGTHPGAAPGTAALPGGGLSAPLPGGGPGPELQPEVPPVVAVGVGDFDHNGVADIIWLDKGTSHIDNWLLAYS